MAKSNVKINMMTGPDDVPGIVEQIVMEDRKQIADRFIMLANDADDWNPPVPKGSEYTDKQKAEIIDALKKAMQLTFSVAATVVISKPMPEMRVQTISLGKPEAVGAKESVH